MIIFDWNRGAKSTTVTTATEMRELKPGIPRNHTHKQAYHTSQLSTTCARLLASNVNAPERCARHSKSAGLIPGMAFQPRCGPRPVLTYLTSQTRGCVEPNGMIAR